MRNGNPVVVIVFGMTIFPVAAALVMEAPEAVVAPVMEIPEAAAPTMVVPVLAVALVVVNIPEKGKVLRNIPIHRNHQNLLHIFHPGIPDCFLQAFGHYLQSPQKMDSTLVAGRALHHLYLYMP